MNDHHKPVLAMERLCESVASKCLDTLLGGVLRNVLGQLLDIQTPARRALEFLQRADQAMNSGDLHAARAHLLAATDRLKKDDHTAMVPIRLKVDRAIFELQQLMF